jgi:hypothetical protein
MNVGDKLQLIRALEEREVEARRSSGRVAWTSVLIAALVLLVMIGLGQRELASLNRRAADARKETEAAEARLATVKGETDAALRELEKVRPGGQDATAVEAALDNLTAASVAATAPDPPAKTTTPDGPVLPIAANRKEAIAQLFDQRAAVRVRAYGELLPRYADDPTLVPEILEVARTQPDNANGTYNALVVLSHMKASTLGVHRAEIIAFAEQSQRVGPRVADRAQTLIRRVPAGR